MFAPILKYKKEKHVEILQHLNKLRILQKVDKCSEPGQIGRLLRREGLYSSHLTTWRRARDKGVLQAMKPRKRGRKLKERNPLTSEVARLQKENRKLENKLKQAELIIEAQKKILSFWE